MSATRRPADLTRAFLAMLSYRVDEECQAALEAANRYKRLAVRQAFSAGWFAWRYRVALGDGWTAPQLSRLTRAAFRRGMEAREQYETTHHSLED